MQSGSERQEKGLLGQALEANKTGRHDEAEAACCELLAHNPQNVSALILLGTVLHAGGRYSEAAARLREAVQVSPRSIGALSRLGSVYFALGEYDQSADSFARCLLLEPDCADAYHHLGRAYLALRKNELAVQIYHRAIERAPSSHKSWHNLGCALHGLLRLEESLAAYDKALALQPNLARTHWNRGLVLLKMGRLTEGFRECEWRRQLMDPRFVSPESWRGESIPGKTLLLLAEQGFGDMIHFVRYARMARERAGRVIVECQPELKTLFEFSRCADAVTVVGEPAPAFDRYAPLLSLPAIFETTLETIPARIPYLTAPPGNALPPVAAGNLRVGLAWAGNPLRDDNAWRSIPLEQFLPLLETPRVSFFSLQLPGTTGDRTGLPAVPEPIDLVPPPRDFADTASAIVQLDLVISVDTAVAHLAGALGKPVWTFLLHASDWRWFMDRTDSPWYPTMRLFRQNQRDDWQPVLAQAAEELRQMARR